jgi:hypothetical protein
MSKIFITTSLLIHLIFFVSSDVYSSSIKEDYELQEKCGRRCEEVFKKDHGNGIINNEQVSGIITYHNHYNRKLNKCFYIVENVGVRKNQNNINYKMKFFWDINEMKSYGYFNYGNNSDLSCDVLGKKCKSEREWDLLVKPYMEE